MPQNASRMVRILCLGLAVLGSASGCSQVMTQSGVRIRSIDEPVVLEPRVVSSGYRWRDASTADIFVSDIPAQRLASADSLEELSGSIVHIHMFLRPKPGKTPIETTASTVTIQCAVLARGEVGIYGGGGFMFPSGAPGDKSFGGSIRNASVKLLASTPGFADRLGAAELGAGIKAPEDEGAAAVMEHLFEYASRVARGEARAGG